MIREMFKDSEPTLQAVIPDLERLGVFPGSP